MSAPHDLLDDLIATPGPFASVYLRSPSGTEDAAHRFDVRWRNVRRQIAEDPNASELLPGLDDAASDFDHGDAAAVAIFASPSGVVVRPLDDEIHGDVARVEGIPSLVPVLHAEQRSVPHVMVLTDRTGADIVAVVDAERVAVDEVEGDTLHIHRGRFGGWSHRRFQQRAENRWESNAREVAERVEEISRSVGARLVTIAGDVRACQLLREHLADDVAEVSIVLDVGDPDTVAEATVRLAADVVARDTREVLEDFAGRAAHGAAVACPGPVLAALSEGRVAKLLVVDDQDDARRAWFAPGDSPACSTERTAPDWHEARLVDVAVRAALLTDVDVRVVPSHVVDEDIGAILRW